jgi:hypothetical protein
MSTRPKRKQWMKSLHSSQMCGGLFVYGGVGAAVLFVLLAGLFPAGAQTKPQALSASHGAVGELSPSRLKGLLVHPQSDSIQVTLELEAGVTYKSGWLSPRRLYFDLLNTQIAPALKERKISVGHTYLNRIRIVQEHAKVTRVVFDLNSSPGHTISELSDPPRLVVNLKGQSQADQAPPKADAISPALEISATPAARLLQKGRSSAAQPSSGAAPAGRSLASARPALMLEPRPVLQIPRVSRPPKLEDFLHGTPREAETQVTGFRQREPGDGVPASQETSAYLSYDDKNLYVVFVCKDEPGKIRAHMEKREEIDGDDQVAIYLDTFRDHQRAYLFATNPLGIQLDGIFTEGGEEPDFTFDTLWYSAGRLTEDGYVVWIAIPFKSLRFPSSDPQSWGIALKRAIVRTNEDTFWPYITDRIEGFTQQMATLENLRRISPGRNIQLIPYAMFTHARALDFFENRAGQFITDNEPRGGLDAKVVLRNALTMDFTVNPDFSNIESDDPQVTINERFEVFFPEKRPFFIENADFFQTPVQLFFSRRVVDPQFGFHTTGKVGRWALGVLAIDDRAEGRFSPADDPLHGRRSGIGVVRLRRDLGDQSNVGMFVSSTDFGPSYNRVFSVDTRLKLSPNWVFTGQAMSSVNRDLGTDQRTAGPGYLAEIERVGRHLNFSSTYEDLSPGFNGDTLGFVPRVDIRQMTDSVSYYWRPEGRRLLSFGPTMSYVRNWNHQGQLQDSIVNPGFAVFFANATKLKFSYTDHFELFNTLGFRHHLATVSFSTAPRPWLVLSTSYDQGTDINFIPNPPLPPFVGNSSGANFAFTLHPSSRLRFDGTYFYTRLGIRPESTPRGLKTSGNLFNNHLLRMKVNYQFTKALSLRAIADYNATLADTSLVNTGNLKTLTGDVLLTYLLNPGTALYIGYTDRFENLVLDPTISGGLRIGGAPTHPTRRQFFVKLSYLLRF